MTILFPVAPERMCSFAETTHTPQGDGNSLMFSYVHFIVKQPTPRKGTEMIYDTLNEMSEAETTHTPQGDGNRSSCHRPPFILKQPTPRKGTEILARSVAWECRKKQPTPRKGTETRYRAQYNEYKRKQPTPRKGTETVSE